MISGLGVAQAIGNRPTDRPKATDLLSVLKAAMVAAHPDKGGDSDTFIAARRNTSKPDGGCDKGPAMKTITLAALITLSATAASADCLSIKAYDRRQACLAEARQDPRDCTSIRSQTTVRSVASAPVSATCAAGGRTASTPAAEGPSGPPGTLRTRGNGLGR